MIRILGVLALVLSIKPIHSQIIYTDVDPDITVTEFQQGYGVDFNNDGKVDIHVTLLSNTGVWVMHTIPDSSVDNTFVVYDGEEASILEYGDEISSNSNLYKIGEGWGGLLYGYWADSGEYGNWTGIQEDKYLGVKFEIGTNFHYGWIHLSTEVHAYNDMEFTLKGFAYETQPNEAIIAGDQGSGVGINETTLNPVIVYPNPVIDILHYQGISDLKYIRILNPEGKLIKTYKHFDSLDKIDLSDLSSGVYILQFTTEKTTLNKRVIKE